MRSVLATGVGAIIGYGIARSAKACRIPLRVVGADIYPDAVGRAWCDEFETAPLSDSDQFPTFLAGLVERHRIDLILPGIEYDVHRLVFDAPQFIGLKARCALNSPNLVRLSFDKWQMHQQLQSAKMPVIPTRLDGSFAELSAELGRPFLLKPRRSWAGKGIRLIEDERDLEYWRARSTQPTMFQQLVGNDDDEFTVGLFGYGDGTYSHFLSLRRRLSPLGSTVKAQVVIIPDLGRVCEELAQLLKPLGPTNLQFRLHNGQFLLLEVNPRFSSSHSIRRAFGINEVELCVAWYLDGTRLPERDLRSGTVVRYLEDHVTYDCDLV
jgi:carbamoyl-phosphate synthase large subunit